MKRAVETKAGRMAGGRSGKMLSLFLACTMAFTSAMPYAAFAQESGMTEEGSAAVFEDTEDSLQENLIESQSGTGESSALQQDDGTGSDDLFLDNDGSDGAVAGDESGAVPTLEADSESVQPAVDPYLNERTREIFLVNRLSQDSAAETASGSGADGSTVLSETGSGNLPESAASCPLMLWNENTAGSGADIWVQHLEQPADGTEYALYGAADASSSSTAYRYEEMKMTDTGLKDSQGGTIYCARIPESWDYVAFAYFASDADWKEETAFDEAGYPLSAAENGRHRSMAVRVSDRDRWSVLVPFTAQQAADAKLGSGHLAWTQEETAKEGKQAFLVSENLWEDATGQTYRKTEVERLDAQPEPENGTAGQTEAAASETLISDIQSGTETEQTVPETEAGQTVPETEAGQTVPETEQTVPETEAGTEAEQTVSVTETETELTVPATEAGTESETAASETEAGTESETAAPETEAGTESEMAEPETGTETGTETANPSASAKEDTVVVWDEEEASVETDQIALANETATDSDHLLFNPNEVDMIPSRFITPRTITNTLKVTAPTALKQKKITDADGNTYTYTSVKITGTTEAPCFAFVRDMSAGRQLKGVQLGTANIDVTYTVTFSNADKTKTITQTNTEQCQVIIPEFDPKGLKLRMYEEQPNSSQNWPLKLTMPAGLEVDKIEWATSNSTYSKISNIKTSEDMSVSTATLTLSKHATSPRNPSMVKVSANMTFKGDSTVYKISPTTYVLYWTKQEEYTLDPESVTILLDANTSKTTPKQVSVTMGTVAKQTPIYENETYYYLSTSTPAAGNITSGDTNVATVGTQANPVLIYPVAPGETTVHVQMNNVYADLDGNEITRTGEAQIPVSVVGMTPEEVSIDFTDTNEETKTVDVSFVGADKFTSPGYQWSYRTDKGTSAEATVTSSAERDSAGFSKESSTTFTIKRPESPKENQETIYLGAYVSGRDINNFFYNTKVVVRYSDAQDPVVEEGYKRIYFWNQKDEFTVQKEVTEGNETKTVTGTWGGANPVYIWTWGESNENYVQGVEMVESKDYTDSAGGKIYYYDVPDGTTGIIFKLQAFGIWTLGNNGQTENIEGKITGGTCFYLTTKYQDGNTKQNAEQLVSFPSGTISTPFQTIRANLDKDTIVVGEKATVTAVASPTYTGTKDITFRSSVPGMVRFAPASDAANLIDADKVTLSSMDAALVGKQIGTTYISVKGPDTAKNGADVISAPVALQVVHAKLASTSDITLDLTKKTSDSGKIRLNLGEGVKISNISWTPYGQAYYNFEYIGNPTANLEISEDKDDATKATSIVTVTPGTTDPTNTFERFKVIGTASFTDGTSETFTLYVNVKRKLLNPVQPEGTRRIYFWAKCSLLPDYTESSGFWTSHVGVQYYEGDHSFGYGATSLDQLGIADDYYDENGKYLYAVDIPEDVKDFRFYSYSTSPDNNLTKSYTESGWNISDLKNGDCFYLDNDPAAGSSVQTIVYNQEQKLKRDSIKNLSSLKLKVNVLTASIVDSTILVGQTTTASVYSSPDYENGENLTWTMQNPATADWVQDTGAKAGSFWDDEEVMEDDQDSAASSVTEEDSSLSQTEKTASVLVEEAEKTQEGEAGTGEGTGEGTGTGNTGNDGTGPSGGTQAGTSVSTARSGINQMTVRGVKAGTTSFTVSGPNYYRIEGSDTDITVTSNTVSVTVVNGQINPDSLTLDLTKPASEDGTTAANTDTVNAELLLGNGIAAEQIVWKVKDPDAADQTKDSVDGITVMQDPSDPKKVTITASGLKSDGSIQTVPDSLVLTATVTYTSGSLSAAGKTDEDKTEEFSVPVTVLSGSTAGYIYYDATLSKLDQEGDGLKENSIPYSYNKGEDFFGDLWVCFYSEDENGNKTLLENYTGIAQKSDQDTSLSGYKKFLGADVKTVTRNGHQYRYTFKIDVPQGAKYVRFADSREHLQEQVSADSTKYIGYDTGYVMLPSAYTEADSSDSAYWSGRNCFYADTADPYIYMAMNGNSSATYRSGYWAEAYTLRNKDDETAQKNKAIPETGSRLISVDNQGSETRSGADDGNILWVNSTFYDYYSDAELNGLNRSQVFSNSEQNNYNNSKGSSRNYATFRQFDQALSDYYQSVPYSGNSAGSVQYPLYTGHFQPVVSGWGNPFNDLANALALYGYKYAGADTYNTFFSTNNSTQDLNGSGDDANRKYDMAAQGLVESDSGSGVKAKGSSVLLPFFNNAFLTGQNSKNAVLGRVYENIDFPFTKYDRDNNGIMYYGFDSARTTLHLEQNYLKTVSQADFVSATSQPTLKQQWDAYNSERGNSAWSKNTDATGTVQGVASSSRNGVSNVYGFFPLNNTSFTGPSAMQNNYGFGTKLEFQFHLSADGNITGSKDGVKTTAPMCFTFSGDDDVWVFIDNKLVLDLGGDHGRVSGCINFSKDKTYHYTYSSYNSTSSPATQLENAYIGAGNVFVSKVKASPAVGSSTDYESGRTQSLESILGSADAVSALYNGNHTLTMYYMERGQWESNMRVEYNFIPKVTLDVNKQFLANGSDDATNWLPDDNAVVYAMVTRHSVVKGAEDTDPTGNNDTEVVVINSGADTPAGKYCLALKKENGWHNSVSDLDQYVDDDSDHGTYVYHVWEVLTGQDGTITTNGTDSAGVGIPKAAKKGDSVYAGYPTDADSSSNTGTGSNTGADTGSNTGAESGSDGNTGSAVTYTKYKVMDSVVSEDGLTTTLINSADVKTSLTLSKKFTGTDTDTTPASIRVKIQRAVSEPLSSADDSGNGDAGNGSGEDGSSGGKDTEQFDWFSNNGYLTVPDGLPENRWQDVTLTESTNGVDSGTDGWFTWTHAQGETDSWTKIIRNLDICPEGGAAEGRFYVYRILEATGDSTSGSSSTAAASGGTTTYGNNSYWVYYTGGQSGSLTNAAGGVIAVQRQGSDGSYTYQVTSTYSGTDKSYEGSTLQLTNVLIVHLPSTGSRTGMMLNILSLICLAAAGSFGIFGRKKNENII